MPGPDMAAADPGGAFPGGAKPCRACSDFKQWAKIGPGIPEITCLYKLVSPDPLLQELLPPSRNNRSKIVFHRKNHLLQKFRRTKIELSLITSLEFVPQIVRFRFIKVSHERHAHMYICVS